MIDGGYGGDDYVAVNVFDEDLRARFEAVSTCVFRNLENAI
jgi:hypothetical protein